MLQGRGVRRQILYILATLQLSLVCLRAQSSVAPKPNGEVPKGHEQIQKGPVASVSNDLAYWGYPSTRAWIDVNNDGIDDFCRVLSLGAGGHVLRCTLSSGRGVDKRYDGQSFETQVRPPDATTRPAWVSMPKDGSKWFCRTIAVAKKRGYLSCIPVTGVAFGNEIRSKEIVDLGVPSGRAWVDFNGDGKPDFCTLLEATPGRGRLSCRILVDDSFNEKPVVSAQMNWRGPSMRQWIETVDGKVTFCTVAGPGSQFVDCIVSNGDSFGKTYRDLIDHRTGR